MFLVDLTSLKSVFGAFLGVPRIILAGDGVIARDGPDLHAS
jgi:hypothetical protein